MPSRFRMVRNALGAAANAFFDDLFEESDVHKAAQQLLTNVKQVYNYNFRSNPPRITDDPKLKHAAEGFIRDLTAVLANDSRDAFRQSRNAQFNLALLVQNIIHDYQPRLESASGFFNQLLAHINNFIEKIANIKDALGETRKTVFSNTDDFADKKRAFTTLKTELEVDEEPESSFTP